MMRRYNSPSVYFVRRSDGEGPVKIGCSEHPEGRLGALMCWSPYPLRIIATTPGDEQVEWRFHAKFEGQHSHREWFLPSAELDDVVAQVRAGTFDVSTLPPPKRLGIHRVMSPEARMDISRAHKINALRRRGVFVPPEISEALHGRYKLPPEALAVKRAIIRDFLDAHGKAA